MPVRSIERDFTPFTFVFFRATWPSPLVASVCESSAAPVLLFPYKFVVPPPFTTDSHPNTDFRKRPLPSVSHGERADPPPELLPESNGLTVSSLCFMSSLPPTVAALSPGPVRSNFGVQPLRPRMKH